MRLRRDARVFLEYKRDDFDEIATVIIVIPRVFEIRFKGEEKKERKKTLDVEGIETGDKCR